MGREPGKAEFWGLSSPSSVCSEVTRCFEGRRKEQGTVSGGSGERAVKMMDGWSGAGPPEIPLH